MTATWRVARAAVGRRRMQTVIIGVVVFLSSATLVVALALVSAASGPFARAFEQQRGAHAVVTFDLAAASVDEVAATADASGVTAAAGPFGVTVVRVPYGVDIPGMMGGPLTVAGRASPGGDVDRLDLWKGRWPQRPGEIVLNRPPSYDREDFHPEGVSFEGPDGAALTIVGYAHSLSRSADAWATPEQVSRWRPTAAQMLFRFSAHDTAAQVAQGVASATAGPAEDAVAATQSYLVVKESVSAGPGRYVVFLTAFGILGLVVAVLMVANVVGGAVVSGMRHIGVLKSLGFTPSQVMWVYLLMVTIPAVAGTVPGTVLGDVGAQLLLSESFRASGLGVVSADRWVDVAVLLGVPSLVAAVAAVPASRARRLSATETISAGALPRDGRAARAQRWLAGRRLPRAMSLGLGLSLARPGRTGLTLAAIVLGITTASLATGLVVTVVNHGEVSARSEAVQVRVLPGDPEVGEVAPSQNGEGSRELLGGLPGVVEVVANLYVPVTVVGMNGGIDAEFLRGDSTVMGYPEQLVEGEWFTAPGDVVVTSRLARERGIAVGDRFVVAVEDSRTEVRVVGMIMGGDHAVLYGDVSTLARLGPVDVDLDRRVQYEVRLAPDTDPAAYAAAVTAADPGLIPRVEGGPSSYTVTIAGLSTTVTVLLGTVAALGVFHTVVLNARERRRDIGVLKSIGMTPRQVTTMMVTSMAWLGVVGGVVGIGLGVAVHAVVVPVAAEAAALDVPVSLLRVWDAPMLVLPAVAGVLIAAAGAYLPARAAARAPIATALRTE
ncbi:putative ABC transport system permease protein [Stackebrandtia albiflava]|uniref:Putative ABC transport system permease protein n=1 Tax=Stackebrandtia albiflava TaxID=406432 RepID=A0A562VER0_9ACTN|nr:FtsX-like permease family protein [Stackebrandtia albiflava]TWJ16376.1 putative ABC transport system permease protein [Stackebrandtia albiflava]